MDEQTIIRIAQEAGIYYRDDYEFCEIDRDGVPMEMMAKFAALVAAAEREACALIADEEFGSTLMIGDAHPKHSSAWRIAAAIRGRKAS